MNVVIILSGGVGSRMGANIPKQYIEVNEKPIIQYCAETFSKRRDIDGFVIGVADEWQDYVKEHLSSISQPIKYAKPGETRQLSIYNALKAAKEAGYNNEDIVIIHDAARPLVTDKIIDECISGIEEGYDGVLPVVKVKDTIYRSVDGVAISQLLNRSELFAGQAPESFKLGSYLSIHDNKCIEEIALINGSTEIAYKSGLSVKLVSGAEINFKITTPEDLVNFEQIIKANESI